MIYIILYSSGEWWVKVVSWYTIMVNSMKFLLYDTTDLIMVARTSRKISPVTWRHTSEML